MLEVSFWELEFPSTFLKKYWKNDECEQFDMAIDMVRMIEKRYIHLDLSLF